MNHQVEAELLERLRTLREPPPDPVEFEAKMDALLAVEPRPVRTLATARGWRPRPLHWVLAAALIPAGAFAGAGAWQRLAEAPRGVPVTAPAESSSLVTLAPPRAAPREGVHPVASAELLDAPTAAAEAVEPLASSPAAAVAVTRVRRAAEREDALTDAGPSGSTDATAEPPTPAPVPLARVRIRVDSGEASPPAVETAAGETLRGAARADGAHDRLGSSAATSAAPGERDDVTSRELRERYQQRERSRELPDAAQRRERVGVDTGHAR